jgi:hypothetical protein
MFKRILFVLAFAFSSFALMAQNESFETFSVLNLSSFAPTTALGMDFTPFKAQDITLAITNPSLLDSSLNNQASISYTNIFNGIWQGNIAYSHSFNKWGSFSLGLNYISYGEFDRYEENGDKTGTFTANDFYFVIGWGRMLDSNLYIGANFKPLFSHYDTYSSSALAFDVALTYLSTNRLFAATLMARNFGAQINTYAYTKEDLPWQLELSVAKKLKHAPLTFYVQASNLQTWDIRETDALNPRDKTDAFTGQVTKENKATAFLDKTFRHLNFGVDFQVMQSLNLSVGYSWRRHKEMEIDNTFSLAGLSYGFGLNIKRFRLSYARNEYHKYGAPNYITLLVKI